MAASRMRPVGRWFVTSGRSRCQTGQEASRCAQAEPERLSVSPSAPAPTLRTILDVCVENHGPAGRARLLFHPDSAPVSPVIYVDTVQWGEWLHFTDGEAEASLAE